MVELELDQEALGQVQGTFPPCCRCTRIGQVLCCVVTSASHWYFHPFGYERCRSIRGDSNNKATAAIFAQYLLLYCTASTVQLRIGTVSRQTSPYAHISHKFFKFQAYSLQLLDPIQVGAVVYTCANQSTLLAHVARIALIVNLMTSGEPKR